MWSVSVIEVQPILPRAKRFSHRTKTGCMVCRTRKVKCDEKRPSCTQCMISRRKCPGYLSDRQTSVADPQRFLKPPRALVSPQLSGSKDIHDLFTLLPGLMDFRGTRGNFLNAPLVMSAINMLQFLPSRVSQHAALDAAITCVATGTRQLLTSRSRDIKGDGMFLRDPSTETSISYLAALATLRQCLSDPRQCTMAETSAAALLICSFETLRDITDNTVYWHMRGLSKLFDHRGPPDLESRFECDLMVSCLTALVITSFYTNTPSFLAKSQWDEAFRYLLATVPAGLAKRQLFIGGWQLLAHTYALLADCSTLVFKADTDLDNIESERDALLEKIEKLEWRWSQRKHEIMGLAGIDPEGDFSAFVDELFQTRQARTGYIIAHATVVLDAAITLHMLRAAIGGTNALVHVEIAQSLAEWLDTAAKTATADDAWTNPLLKGNVSATLQSGDEWRRFAVKRDSTRDEVGCQQVIDADDMRRWLRLAGISPNG